MTTTERRRPAPQDIYSDVHEVDRGRRWPWVLAIALLVALLGGGAYVLWKTPVFAVKRVEINVAKGALLTTVQKATASEIGAPMVSVDVDAITAQIAAVPQVAAVRVVKKWPNALVVTIRARVAVAVTNANGSWWQLDAGGVAYEPGKTKPATLPDIELATPGPDDPATRAALRVIKALPPAVKLLVGHLSATTGYDVTLVLTDGRTVVWGDGSNTAQKAKVLPAVLARPGRTFDLSDPAMVTVK
ncbi:MAG: cell division protein FtsQ/DivIB [Actinomycetota bacterium]|nr:cell division protein FtsQ/DivIB [Actinomycetota bacterium]